jgi:hypothetical protein
MFKISRSVVLQSTKIGAQSRSLSSMPTAGYLPKTEVAQRILEIVKSYPSAPATVSENDHFVADLGFDSILRKSLNEKLMVEFCVSHVKESPRFLSIPDAVSYFSAHPKAR